MEKKHIIIGVGVFVLLVIGAWWFTKSTTPNPLAVINTEEVKIWEFEGPYKANPELETKARTEITRLEKMLNKGEFTDYELYVSIANQYDLLGEGKKEYEYLGKALQIDAEKTGVAWNNVARLMEKLGVYENARIAFDRAIQAQALPAYYMAKLDFLQRHFPEDVAGIEKGNICLGKLFESSNKIYW
jgi:tetratricopeptide (TPR) repeat protein